MATPSPAVRLTALWRLGETCKYELRLALPDGDRKLEVSAEVADLIRERRPATAAEALRLAEEAGQ